jgi:N-glycosylase/DNA lyase
VGSLTIKTGRAFDFRLMVLSHGWHDLAPFRWHEPTGPELEGVPSRRAGKGTFRPAGAKDDGLLGALETVVRVGSVPIVVTLTSVDQGTGATAIRASWPSSIALTRAEQAVLRGRLRWMFRMDEDFGPFHAGCRKRGLPWVAEFGLGPFLRNADWFEEFVKVLLTTNVNWAGTRAMTNRLVEAYGGPTSHPDRRAFPTAEALAATTDAELRSVGRVGYRAPFLIELAEGVASGRIDLAALAASQAPTLELRKELKGLKGFGDYAVNALLLSFGRYDELIFDSWIRPMVAKRHFSRSRVSDRTIRRFYAPWGEWKTLACWFDCAHETWLAAALPKARRTRRRLRAVTRRDP